MCNAWNHPDDCGCGFGPPYAWIIESGETVEWAEEILYDKGSFVRALKDLNFNAATSRQWLAEYGKARSTSPTRRSLRAKLSHLIRRFEYEVEKEKLVWIKVPLFKLHSPACEDAKVSYIEGQATDTEVGWQVKFFGVGMGRTRTIRAACIAEFYSCGGQCRQVFVPVQLRVQQIGVYKDGVLMSRGLRAELADPSNEDALRKRGFEDRPEEHCANEVSGTFKTEEFFLAGAKGGPPVLFQRSWTSDIARDVELGLKVFGIYIQPLANVRRERQLKLEFELPCGRDYQLCSSPGGIHWRWPQIS
ncbi:MAG TPA: hypothetical protein VFR31_02490 [Thermoanaerobaculia bacterium]|nr:hypothetical protein [Thermoanaerobaculia bacterium]